MARDLFTKAIVGYRAFNDRTGLALCHAGMGKVFQRLGQLDIALASLQQAHELYAVMHSASGIADSLERLASLHIDRDEALLAGDCLDDALDLYRDIGHEAGSARCATALRKLGGD